MKASVQVSLTFCLLVLQLVLFTTAVQARPLVAVRRKQLQNVDDSQKKSYTATIVTTRSRIQRRDDLVIDTSGFDAAIITSTIAYQEIYPSGVRKVQSIVSFSSGKVIPPSDPTAATKETFIPNSSRKYGISTAGIVGIAIGIPLFLLTGIIIFLVKHRRQQRQAALQQITANPPIFLSHRKDSISIYIPPSSSSCSHSHPKTSPSSNSSNSTTAARYNPSTNPNPNIPQPPPQAHLFKRFSRHLHRKSQVIVEMVHPGTPWGPQHAHTTSAHNTGNSSKSPEPTVNIRPPTPLAELASTAAAAELDGTINAQYYPAPTLARFDSSPQSRHQGPGSADTPSPISPEDALQPFWFQQQPRNSRRPQLPPIRTGGAALTQGDRDEQVSALSPVTAFGYGYQSELPEVVTEVESAEERRIRMELEEAEQRMEMLRREQRRAAERRRRRSATSPGESATHHHYHQHRKGSVSHGGRYA